MQHKNLKKNEKEVPKDVGDFLVNHEGMLRMLVAKTEFTLLECLHGGGNYTVRICALCAG